MTPEQVIGYYDGNKSRVKRELLVSWQTVHNWSLQGYIPPASQRRIEWATRGKLLADSTCAVIAKAKQTQLKDESEGVTNDEA